MPKGKTGSRTAPESNINHGVLLKKIPPVPKKFEDARVRTVWKKVMEDLDMAGRLYDVVVHIVEQYCDCYLHYLNATDTLEKDGQTTNEKYTQALRKHPALQVRKDNFSMMQTLETKLGLTPKSRDQIRPADATNKEKKKDPFGDYLNN